MRQVASRYLFTFMLEKNFKSKNRHSLVICEIPLYVRGMIGKYAVTLFQFAEQQCREIPWQKLLNQIVT